ncbi:hypothetical protein DOQ08_02017 [Marinobacter litoralis]|uniref:Fibronectin type-III domain-containing protein n=1 Tax=Marinobacter litoralis TaxID=187981 RepID=A0A3M2RBP1_9GAMM|nr:fibronectin type III domain-containing protein [Marinobacter litoralis]RMJ02554.1 hypothetical protein DOQ08_02017 [Marinobacter litoralis]
MNNLRSHRPGGRPRVPLTALFAISTLFLTGCQDGAGTSNTANIQHTETTEHNQTKRFQGNTSGPLTNTADSFSKRSPANQTLETPKTLVWSAPLTREDGSSLAIGQIAEYRIYYRLKYKDRFSVIPITDTSNTKYPLTGLPPGAYEFSITTVDAEGLESRRSESVEINLI